MYSVSLDGSKDSIHGGYFFFQILGFLSGYGTLECLKMFEVLRLTLLQSLGRHPVILVFDLCKFFGPRYSSGTQRPLTYFSIFYHFSALISFGRSEMLELPPYPQRNGHRQLQSRKVPPCLQETRF